MITERTGAKALLWIGAGFALGIILFFAYCMVVLA
jgi:hypothetical protein